LYEEGLITYMRTDSVHLSQQAISAARKRITALYGEGYLSPTPRQFTTQQKGAQEAHEAIRPAGTEMRPVDETGLTGREAALYEMIWKRTVASQMAEARVTQLAVSIGAADALFRASGKRIDFPGFFRAYVEGSDDPEAALEDREEPLPALRPGDLVDLRHLQALSHETQPPARFTEASLVKTLESDGIGRPSTYASIIGTIIDRGYVDRQGTQLIPTFTAFAVTGLLERYFPSLVDVRFTARMEEELDEIADGDGQWLPYLTDFFLGPDGLEQQVVQGEQRIDPRDASTVRLEGLPAVVRIGKFGPYVELKEGDETITASLPENVAPADISREQVLRLVKAKAEGPDILGEHPETGEPVFLLTGRFGPYVQLGDPGNGKPRRASLPKDADPTTFTLERALQLLSLPRNLGRHPESGEPIEAGIGRFGPFVVHQKDFRSLTPQDNVYTIGLERALELLSEPKRGRKSAEPLREVGRHPADGEPILLLAGRYGPYVKHGDLNATLPKGVEPATLTLDAALRLLEQRATRTSGSSARRPQRARTAAKSESASTAARRTGKASSSKRKPTEGSGRKPRSTAGTRRKGRGKS
jgi:DNA topoisomerase-1